MANQMVLQERPFAVYRLVGEGPIGFSVMGFSGAPPELAEKLPPWKDWSHKEVKPAIAAALGEFIRSQDLVKLSEVAAVVGLSPSVIIRFGQRGGELAEGLYAIQPDLEPDAIGGYLFVGDFWHWGHTREFLNEEEAFVPYDWALRVLAELERRKAAEPVSAGSV